MSSTMQISTESMARARVARGRNAYTTWMCAACVCAVAIVSGSLWHAVSAIQVVA
jgi:hypothetical protein